MARGSDDHGRITGQGDAEALVARLRGVLGADDPPAALLAAARAAFELRDLDAELAGLVGDSDLEPAGVRGPEEAAVRLVSFAHGEVRVDLQVAPHGGRGDLVDLTGQVVGVVLRDCWLDSPSHGPREVELDDLGRFLVLGVERGPVRLRYVSTAGRPGATTWTTL